MWSFELVVGGGDAVLGRVSVARASELRECLSCRGKSVLDILKIDLHDHVINLNETSAS